ncbi:MAG: hypothetical protein WCD86_00125 [Ktedonobacteraceae bacterium]
MNLLSHLSPGLILGATTSIQQFFANLTTDLFAFILTASVFALAWAAFLYMFSGENERRIQQAKFWLYAAMVGLAVALLGPTIAGIINAAAGGAGH